MSLRFGDVAYVAVLVWALIGIAVRLSETTPILVASLAGAAVLALSLLATARRGARVSDGGREEVRPVRRTPPD